MLLELFIAAAGIAVGQSLFAHFEERTPPWRRFLKVVLLLGVTALLSAMAGRTAALAWIALALAGGTTVHFVWSRRHGIDPFTAEPRDRYYRLRGWEWPGDAS